MFIRLKTRILHVDVTCLQQCQLRFRNSAVMWKVILFLMLLAVDQSQSIVVKRCFAATVLERTDIFSRPKRNYI